MKKSIISAILSCLLLPAFALSWGGVVDNNTRLTSDKDFKQLGLSQSNGVHLSFNAPFNTDGSVKVVGEGSFKYVFNQPDLKASDTSLLLVPDLDLFKFAGNWAIANGSVSLDLGRFSISDFSGVVFTQKSDGLNIAYNTSLFKVGAYAGYTGLQNRLNVSMTDNEFEEDDNYYKLTAAYVPVMVDLSYRALFETSTIGIQGAFFMPLSEDNTQKLYGSLILNGPIGLLGAYNLKGTFGLNDMKDPMVDASADLNLYFAGSSIFTAGAEFVSFESDGHKQFITVTTRSACTDPLFAGGILPKVSFIYAKNSIYAALTGKGVISMTTEDTKFDGVDASAGLIYNIFSDLQIGFDLGAFIGIDEDVKDLSIYSATIKASFAF